MTNYTVRINPLAVPVAGVAWAQFLLMLQVIPPYRDYLTGGGHLRGRGAVLFVERFITSEGATGNLSMALLVFSLTLFSASLLSAIALSNGAKESTWSIKATNVLGFVGFVCWVSSVATLLAFYNWFLLGVSWLGLIVCVGVSSFYRKNGSFKLFWRAIAFRTLLSVSQVEYQMNNRSKSA